MTVQERPGRVTSRRAAILVAVVAVLALTIGLSIAFGVGPSGPISPASPPGTGLSASPAFSDLPLVTVAPAAAGATSAPASDAGSPGISPSPGGTAGRGVRANHIQIARLGIDLAIVEGDGIDAPIGKAAHYPGSAWPGGGSNIYIYAHARVGMFITLWQVRLGDTVTLQLADGTSRTYVVTKILPKVPFDAVQYLQPTKTEQLTLQTSTSYYSTAPRFVVIAAPQT
jgi:LPXTG-site transpeptidase (sortase) family protein